VLSKRLVIGASLVLLAGCKDSNSPTGFQGTVSFSYSGAISGNFSATGAMPASQSQWETSSWAAGEVSTTDGVTYVVSVSPRSATTNDFAFFYAERITTGSSDFSVNCSTNCAYGTFEFGVQNVTGNSWLQSCTMVSGTVTITEVSSTRIKGTFSGTAECFAPGSSVPQSLTIANGSFDVARMSDLGF
jgi:hypothetical protein